MPLPPRRKRCSFGGNQGVWWRRKNSSACNSTPTISCPVTLLVDDVVKWDESLARPIYRRHSIVCENQITSSSEDTDEDNTFLPSTERHNTERSSITTTRKKNKKTFGGRSRRPLSLLLSQDNLSQISVMMQDSKPSGSETRGSKVNSNSDDTSRQSTEMSSTNVPDSDSTYRCNPDVFDFVNNEEPTPSTTPQRPTANSSIEQAKKYFAHLDSSCHLHMDSSASPTPHRSVIRTTRKIQLSSPGFIKEYSKYAQATQELGISPLKTVEYAKSRRRFFRKTELFDGFVDS